MEMIFDLFDELLNSEMLCFFHNRMWQSWNSEVNVELLHLYGSLHSCWVFDVLVIKTKYLSRSSLWTLVHLRVSPFLIIGFLVLAGFVGYLCWFQRLLNPILSSNCLYKNSSVVVEMTHILSGMWLLQIPWQQLSRYNKLECIVKDDCITS